MVAATAVERGRPQSTVLLSTSRCDIHEELSATSKEKDTIEEYTAVSKVLYEYFLNADDWKNDIRFRHVVSIEKRWMEIKTSPGQRWDQYEVRRAVFRNFRDMEERPVDRNPETIIGSVWTKLCCICPPLEQSEDALLAHNMVRLGSGKCGNSRVSFMLDVLEDGLLEYRVNDEPKLLAWLRIADLVWMLDPSVAANLTSKVESIDLTVSLTSSTWTTALYHTVRRIRGSTPGWNTVLRSRSEDLFEVGGWVLMPDGEWLILAGKDRVYRITPIAFALRQTDIHATIRNSIRSPGARR